MLGGCLTAPPIAQLEAVLRLLTEATARGHCPEHADGRYRDALTLAEELRMLPLIAHCHLGLGKLYRRTGQHEQAQEHLTTATTMYREMGMTYWLEKALLREREDTRIVASRLRSLWGERASATSCQKGGTPDGYYEHRRCDDAVADG